MVGDPGAIENSMRETREAAHMNLVGGPTSGGADRIVEGKFNVRSSCAPQTSWRSLTTIASIWAIVWLTHSAPPLPLGW